MSINKPGSSLFHLLLLAIFLFQAGCATIPDSVQVEKPVFPPPPDQPRFHYQQSLISSADVEQEGKEAAFKRLITGQARTGFGMGKPFAVSVHQGRVFVSDTQQRKVHAFDKREGRYFEIGTTPPGELSKPMGLDVDRDGNLYVCDASMKRVVVFDRDGNYLRTLGHRDLFSRPAGLAVDPDGKKVFVVDTGGVSSDWHRVVVLDAQTGEFLYNISQRGSGEGELNLPRDAVIAADGNLYVVDGGNFRIQVFSQQGEFIRSFGDIGRRGGQFSRPKGIGSDKDGNIYVSDAAFGNFQIFNPAGQLLLAVGRRDSRAGPANFMLPAGLDVDEDGRVYMVDQYFRKVDVFRPASITEEQGFFGLPRPAENE
ncbi:MAG: 6-bladed beta-propeller [Proteobacteria bacterium]|nr:6-bladed beta-propeller [Pseudomonadota bacterium]MCH8176773.1 6-bladed beta-propeller [Pseudomonadota bacterium]